MDTVSTKRVGSKCHNFVGHSECTSLRTNMVGEELSHVPQDRKGLSVASTGLLRHGFALGLDFLNPEAALVTGAS